MTKKSADRYSALKTDLQKLMDKIEYQHAVSVEDVKEVEGDLARIQAMQKANPKDPVLFEVLLLTHRADILTGQRMLDMTLMEWTVLNVIDLTELLTKQGKVKLTVKRNVEKELKSWTAHMEAARKAQEQYVR